MISIESFTSEVRHTLEFMSNAGDRAAARAAELQRRKAELADGRQVTGQDVRLAVERAEQSRQSAERAHSSSAERHEEAAQLHQNAADVHDMAMITGSSDVETHTVRAQEHRQGAENDWAAAERAKDRAEEERP